MRFEFATEGKNSFTVAGASCDAPRGGTCAVEVSTADLQAGWNEISIETRRRTGEEEALSARVFVGEEAFRRTCEVTEVGGPDPRTLVYELACTFDEGFHGVLDGAAMLNGRATIPAAEVEVDEDPAEAGVLRPLVMGRLPVVVTNRAGGEWRRPVGVVVPLPLVQLSVKGWQNPWYEDTMPLRIRAEQGASISIDGESVRPARDGASFTVDAAVKPGPNTIRIEASKAGRVPAKIDLKVRGKAPDTPLYVFEPATDHVVTDQAYVRIRGQTSPDAKLYLANRPMDTGSDGTFDLVVPLDEGDNEVSVLAVVDPSLGVRARPPTKRTFTVVMEARAEPRQRTYTEEEAAETNTAVLVALGKDPWSHVGALVEFPMVVDEMATSLVKDGCEARLEGDACTHEVERDVRVGFDLVTARACDGDLVPAVVELDHCPTLERGDRLLITGKVLGGLGGRVGQLTVERPRFRATRTAPAPWVLDGEP